jgi:hypothetical protein
MAARRTITIWALAAVIAVVLALFAMRKENSIFARRYDSPRTRPVTISLLPSFVNVFENEGFAHEFTIPSDATNAHLQGEFTVDLRPSAQIDMLVVSAAASQHWQKLLSPTGSPGDPGSSELIYHSGATSADLFDVKMTPGTYDLIFYYEPPPSSAADHFGGSVAAGPVYRIARTKITLNYDLPQEQP